MDAAHHRCRLKNLNDVNTLPKKVVREHWVHDYLAGQVIYHLGEYPKRFSMAPTEYDERLLETFAAHGAKLIQLHEDWHDSQRLLGADKFTPHDRDGFIRFVDRVHALGMKIIVYASTGYFESRDPDFDPAWDINLKHINVHFYFRYAHCSPASPEWRAYLLPRLERIMDEYGVDGLYNDFGYMPLGQHPVPPGHVSPAPETSAHDAALEDLLWTVLNLVHHRNGVYKAHYGGLRKPLGDRKMYDYIWVGEYIASTDTMRLQTRYYEPYVVPCIDLSHATLRDDDEPYRLAVPYLQFPLRVDGRPFTGECAAVPRVEYADPDKCFVVKNYRKYLEYYRTHPEAPAMYGEWDSFPGKPERRETWLRHLDMYLPMVKEGTRVWIDISDSPVIEGKKDESLVASLFVNDEVYMVVANYAALPATFTSVWPWKDRESGVTARTITVPPHKLLYLVRAEEAR
ncbi:MAG: hypothetical protein A3K19_04985 [Lentisphaerae bacterium RIFOXYB12_FULL_65_16]|nr:MAG: hypothetical protein A3K18_35365 [Lentisphaerae bacterium RIFOXYA12_64_32]OGV89746.1 MAG: hypothetical protein A3K19_04985 [Lentisphaerae bacterium RIFOXYB12_FULL_65_16]